MDIEQHELVKICKARLQREFEVRDTRVTPTSYLEGYKEAICDIIWDYFKVPVAAISMFGLDEDDIANTTN